MVSLLNYNVTYGDRNDNNRSDSLQVYYKFHTEESKDLIILLVLLLIKTKFKGSIKPFVTCLL